MKRKLFKRTACTAIAAAITAAGTCIAVPAVSAETSADPEIIRYEFEDGFSSDTSEVYTEGWTGNTAEDGSGEEYDLTNASDGGFVFLGQKGTKVSVDVTVEEAGLYEMSICYCQPSDAKKVQYLNINGTNQGEVSFVRNLTFEEAPGGIVLLQEGVNTIELESYWGYTYYDYLTVKPADESISALSPTRQLSNPNASESTKRLYNYLCDVYGNNIISGQQEYCGSHNYNSWNDPDTYIKDNEAEFQYILEKTGEQPAIRGIDFLSYNTTDTSWRDNAPERCIEWVNEYNGIATVSWHWNVPVEEGSTKVAFYVESASDTYTTFSITNALTEGTWENEVLMADIELIAGELTKLKEADVPILWRPLHEAEGAWFWWGAEGPEPCKQLYRLLYDQLTNVYGLDNLIWTWTGYTYPTSSEWYPGDDVVDLMGYDKYNAKDGQPNLSSISSTFYTLVQSTDGEKMVAMTENDTIPSLENLLNDKAKWLYFCPWYMNYLTSEQNNPVDNLVEIYQSEYCITLDELPDLKSYPISSEEPTTEPVTDEPTTAPPTTETSSAEEEIFGDANLSGELEISDAVKIMSHVTDKVKYPLTDAEANLADVYQRGDGISNMDALSVQKKLAQLITELPETYM
ncbi:MAG: glycoside hydrolase [Ruminococcus sp.]|nr:glycoside hydrolase [Ruminococcus sp.]